MKEFIEKNLIKIGVVTILIAVVLIFTTFHFQNENNCSTIAVIPITGILYSSPQYNDDGSVDKSVAVAIDIITKIRKANEDKRVKAIVFSIDSRGGDTASAEEIAMAIKEVKKPTVALIRSRGESSAYWIASATGRIFALPVSGTVDIGVTNSYVDNSIQNTENGLTFNQVSYGKYKDMQNPDKPLTADEKTLLMAHTTEIANVFIQEVAENRHLPIEKIQSFADGSLILGMDAIKEGLIDEIGSFSDVDRYLSKILNRNVEMCISDEK